MITRRESDQMFVLVREIVKSNEKKIIDAAPSNFTAIVNISAISLPEPIESPFESPLTPSTKSPSKLSSIPELNTQSETTFKYVSIGDNFGQIKIFKSSSSSLPLSFVSSFQAHSTYIERIKQSPFDNSNYVASCGDDNTVKIWNISSSISNWTLVQTFSNHSSLVFAMEWIDNDTVASCGETDRIIQIWSIRTGEIIKSINTSQYTYCLNLLKNNHLAAGGNGPSNINIYNLTDGSLISSLQGHTDDINDMIKINESDDLLASSSTDNTVKIWNLKTNECKFTLQGHTNSVNGIKQINSEILASGSFDYTIKLWNITSGKLIRTLRGHTDQIRWSLDLLKIGGQAILVSGCRDQTVKFWNWSTGECLQTVNSNSFILSLDVIDISDMNL